MQYYVFVKQSVASVLQMDGRTVATPLLLCLLVVESSTKPGCLNGEISACHVMMLRFSDIVFATDSVPAVLGTTKAQPLLK